MKTIAMPASSAALITSSSRMEPPGWMTAAAPTLFGAPSELECGLLYVYILPMENIYGRSMLRESPSLFTVAEAAAVTGLPLKAVNNAIDKRTIRAHVRRREGRPVRLIDEWALIYLALETALAGDTTLPFRRKLSEAIAAVRPGYASIVEVGPLKVDLRKPRRDVAEKIKELRRAEKLAESDPGILGGTPVFRGTRVSIHLIADLVRQGESVENLRKGYPRISDEMIQLAPIFAKAHPVRGRPRRHPARERQIGREVRVRLSDLTAS